MIRKRYRYVLKKETLLIVLGIFIGLLTFIGISYAIIVYYNNSDDSVHSIVAGNLKIVFKDSNNLNIDNMYPMTIEEGMNSPIYSFTITNTGTVNAKYIVKLSEDTTVNLVNHQYMIFCFKKGNNPYTVPKKVSDLGTDLIIDNGFLAVNEEINYELKVWLDESAPNSEMGKVYKTKVIVEAVNTITNAESDIVRPIINLNGEKVINLKTNDKFTDPGINMITDNVDQLPNERVKVSYEYYDGNNFYLVDKVDTSKNGVYYIYYEVFDNNLNSDTETRVVNVNSKANLFIKLIGDSNVSTHTLASYSDLGAQVVDSSNNYLHSNITKIMGLNTDNKKSLYFIKYLTKDGNELYSNVRKVIVKDANTIYDAITKNDISNYYGSLKELDNQIYISGSNPNNYLSYSNILFRIVKVDKTTNSITAITDSSVTDLVPNTKVYKDSNVYSYLNNEFINKLLNHSYLIKNSDDTYISILTKDIYDLTHQSITLGMGYLVKDKNWLILNNGLTYVDTNGEVKDTLSSSLTMVRAVINLKGDLIVTGSGTSSDPYLLQ